jgi:hypothetical protein
MNDLKTGDKVKMVNCLEAERYGDKVWECRSESFTPKNYPDEKVVFLENYPGWFSCEFLETIKK